MMNSILRSLSVLGIGLSVSACNMTSRMEIPELTTPESVVVDPSEKFPTLAFQKAVAKIRRGTAIAHFPSSLSDLGLDAMMCNHRYRGSNNKIEWITGTSVIGGWADEVGQIFNETMSSIGYTVVGSADKLFDTGKDRSAAEYLIGAKITEIKGNFCEEHDFWYGMPQGRYAGEIYMKVEWEVYAATERRVVGKLETEGYHIEKKATSQGRVTAMLNAFAAATDTMATHPEFVEFLRKNAEPQVAWAPSEAFSLMRLPFLDPRKSRIKDVMSERIDGSVVIRSGAGHGSGFAITDDGFLLTNHHVVGDAAEVQVVFSNGIEVPGVVVRSDKIRDVALVKVPLRGLSSLPIHLNGTPQPGADIYAIGAPKDENLHSTVSKGIVSALRRIEQAKLKYIQADVTIHGGNSGGPLLDENGNVVGITVAGLYMLKDTTSAGLNLFIPIQDALDALNVVQGEPGS